MKNSNDTIGNQTRDLPACSAMPQPTAPPRAPNMYILRDILQRNYLSNGLHYFGLPCI